MFHQVLEQFWVISQHPFSLGLSWFFPTCAISCLGSNSSIHVDLINGRTSASDQMTPHPHHRPGPAVGKLVTLYNSTTYFSLVFHFPSIQIMPSWNVPFDYFILVWQTISVCLLCNCSIINTLSIFNQYQMHSRFQILLIRTWFAFYYMTLIDP